MLQGTSATIRDGFHDQVTTSFGEALATGSLGTKTLLTRTLRPVKYPAREIIVYLTLSILFKMLAWPRSL
jgi:hypothetical protein